MATQPKWTDNAATVKGLTAMDMVTICGWCPNLNILKLQRRDTDVVIVYQQGKDIKILRNGTLLAISHGICDPCRAKLKAQP